jgi:pimeloyl-ACP methyl ester carboxylesterase
MKLELISRRPVSASHTTPLLFVHGAGAGAWCWDEHFLPYFADRGFTAHALSLRHHGESENTGSLRRIRVSDYVDDVASVAAGFERPPAIIGHSMGGFVAQHYLARNAAPAAVLLASAPPTGVWRTTLKLARRHPLAFLKANATWSLYPFVATPALARDALFSPEMDPAATQNYWRKLTDESWLAYLDMLGLDLPDTAAVKTPLLVLGGARDALFSPRDVEGMARAYGVEAEIFADVAHAMMLEARWRDVAARIAGWLSATLAG